MNRQKITLTALTIVALSLPAIAWSEENITPEAGDTVTSTTETINTEENDVAPSGKPDPTPSPEAASLRTRAIDDSFINFKPSEEISADNAVSFPVDI